MLQQDAATILGLSGHITPDMVKAAYRAAAKKWHPDHNTAPEAEHMMKLVNAAFDVLRDHTGPVEESKAAYASADYIDALADALNAIADLDGLDIEICGVWVWVGGNTRTHKEALKAAGFRWSKKKVRWYYRPAEWKSSGRGNWSMDKIRERHGSRKVRPQGRSKIEDQEAA